MVSIGAPGLALKSTPQIKHPYSADVSRYQAGNQEHQNAPGNLEPTPSGIHIPQQNNIRNLKLQKPCYPTAPKWQGPANSLLRLPAGAHTCR